jgi:hypothetical protein
MPIIVTGRLFEVTCTLRRGNNYAVTAISDVTKVIDMQRRDDVAAAEIILDGKRILEHRDGIHLGVLALGYNDRAKLTFGRAVQRHPTAEVHCGERARVEPPERRGGLWIANRETIAVGGLIGPIYHGNVIRHASVHDHRGVMDHRGARCTSCNYGGSDLWVDTQFASDLERITRPAVALLGHQPVDLLLLESRVLERQFEGLYRNFVRTHAGQFTLLSLPEAYDARLVPHILEHRFFTSFSDGPVS